MSDTPIAVPDDKVESILGMNSENLLFDQNLITLHGQLSDSFIATTIVKVASNANKITLFNSLKVIELIRSISSNTTTGQIIDVYDFYNSAIVLPTIISSIPRPETDDILSTNPYDLLDEDTALKTEEKSYDELKKITHR